MAMRCIVPGCGKELPTDAKIPICKHHEDVFREQAAKIGTGVLAVGSGIAIVAKNGGIDFVKKNGPEIARAIKNNGPGFAKIVSDVVKKL